MTDSLDSLHDRLAALDDVPVADHPDALDDVHRALVAELDALDDVGGAVT